MMKQDSLTPQKCFPWEETSTKLGDWTNNVLRTTNENTIGFNIHFDVAHSTSTRNEWTNFGYYNGQSSFIKYVDNNVKLNDNNDLKNLEMSDRVEYSYTHNVQLISSSRFDFTFKRAVTYIQVAPSSSWFNRDMIAKYSSYFNRNELPLLPKGF
jgi:hypothetical protein